MKLQQYRGTEALRITAQKGKAQWLCFACIISSQAGTAQHQEGTPQLERVLSTWVNEQLPQPFGALYEGSASVSPHPETCKAKIHRDG